VVSAPRFAAVVPSGVVASCWAAPGGIGRGVSGPRGESVPPGGNFGGAGFGAPGFPEDTGWLPAAATVVGVGFVGPGLLVGGVWLSAVVGVGFVGPGLLVDGVWLSAVVGVGFAASVLPDVPALPCAAPVLLRGAELAGEAFGVPVVPDCLAALPGFEPAPGRGVGDGRLSEPVGVAAVDLLDAEFPLPGRVDELVVTVLRDPGPGVTVLCAAVPDRLTPAGSLPVPGCARPGLFMAGLPAVGCDVAGPGASNSVGSECMGPDCAARDSDAFTASGLEVGMPPFAGPGFGAGVACAAPRTVSAGIEASVPAAPDLVGPNSPLSIFLGSGFDGSGAGVLVFAAPGPAGSGGWAAAKEPGVASAEMPGDGDGGVGRSSTGFRLEAGGPGFGRFRSGAGRRASARPRWGTLMSATHAGRRP
jgi:hypothetical protein